MSILNRWETWGMPRVIPSRLVGISNALLMVNRTDNARFLHHRTAVAESHQASRQVSFWRSRPRDPAQRDWWYYSVLCCHKSGNGETQSSCLASSRNQELQNHLIGVLRSVGSRSTKLQYGGKLNNCTPLSLWDWKQVRAERHHSDKLRGNGL